LQCESQRDLSQLQRIPLESLPLAAILRALPLLCSDECAALPVDPDRAAVVFRLPEGKLNKISNLIRIVTGIGETVILITRPILAVLSRDAEKLHQV
jgi:hypothetical protein